MDAEKLKLQKANIPERYWDSCYISDDGTIWTPATDEGGEILQTGKEVYKDYITRKKMLESEQGVYS